MYNNTKRRSRRQFAGTISEDTHKTFINACKCIETKFVNNACILDNQGNLDLAKCDGILFDQASGRYFKIGEFLAQAFSVGMALKK